MNTELLLKVKEEILAEPRKLHMDTWLWDAEDYLEGYGEERIPPCKTVGCIAGWTVAVAAAGRQPHDVAVENRLSNINIGDRAQLLLDLNSKKLFFHNEEAATDWIQTNPFWPEEFIARLEKESPGTVGYAQVVADVIDDLIANPAAWGEEA